MFKSSTRFLMPTCIDFLFRTQACMQVSPWRLPLILFPLWSKQMFSPLNYYHSINYCSFLSGPSPSGAWASSHKQFLWLGLSAAWICGIFKSCDMYVHVYNKAFLSAVGRVYVLRNQEFIFLDFEIYFLPVFPTPSPFFYLLHRSFSFLLYKEYI